MPYGCAPSGDRRLEDGENEAYFRWNGTVSIVKLYSLH